MNDKDITQAALFKSVNLNKAENKNRNKSMIQSYKDHGVALKSQASFTQR